MGAVSLVLFIGSYVLTGIIVGRAEVAIFGGKADYAAALFVVAFWPVYIISWALLAVGVGLARIVNGKGK